MTVFSFWVVFFVFAIYKFVNFPSDINNKHFLILFEWGFISTYCFFLYALIQCLRWGKKEKAENNIIDTLSYQPDSCINELCSIRFSRDSATDIVLYTFLFNIFAIFFVFLGAFGSKYRIFFKGYDTFSLISLVQKKYCLGFISLVVLLIDCLLVYWLRARKKKSFLLSNQNSKQQEEYLEIGERLDPCFALLKLIVKRWYFILQCLSVLLIVLGFVGLLCWNFPQIIPTVQEGYVWFITKLEFYLRFWWGKAILIGVVSLSLIYVIVSFVDWRKRVMLSQNYLVVGDRNPVSPSPMEIEQRSIILKDDGGRHPIVPSVDPNINEILGEIGKAGRLEAWRKTKNVERTRRKAVQIIDAEIEATKKRVEYIRNIAEESSVIDEERLRIAKIRKEMDCLDLQDKVERKRIKKELEELERDIRILRQQPEAPPKILSEEKKREEVLRRSEKQNEFEIKRKVMQAKKGLAARKALMEAKNQEIAEIKNSNSLNEEEKNQLIEDMEDYYNDLIDQTT